MVRRLVRSLRRKRYAKLIERSGLFDEDWYRETYGIDHSRDPIRHYIKHVGDRRLRPFKEFPCGLVDAVSDKDLKRGKNPLIRFLRHLDPDLKTNPEAIRQALRAADSARSTLESDDLESDDLEPNELPDALPRVLVPMWQDPFANWARARGDVQEALRDKDCFLSGSDTPKVSVILPVHNQFHYTLRCVWSIVNAKEPVPFEVIMSDNLSEDETYPFFKDLPGITYLRNDPDLGFLRSCNKASRFARGEYLYLLNNDTAVLDNWLSSLVRDVEENAEIGLAGSMLFYPDGALQESGGMIWNDGSAANLGRNEEFVSPLYAAMRDADYVSGAGILVRRSLWDRFGGFDERFVPVYCEDSDLALSVRQHGYRSVVQPQSKIVHFEGRTNGTDVGTGMKAYQVANADKLKKKWAFTLERHHTPRNLHGRTMRRFQRPRILLIDHKVPKPNEDAGSLTAVWVMRILARMGYDITFLSQDLRPDPVNEKELNALGVEVLRWPDVTNLDDYLDEHAAEFGAFLLYRPMSGGVYAAKLRELNPDAPQLYFTVDIHFLRHERARATGASSVEDDGAIAQLRQTELNLIASCDASIVLSRAEMELLGDLGLGGRLHHLPLILENAKSPPPRDNREGICFVGGYQHLPNVDAVTWFVTEVWPLVRKRLPDLRFYIVGSHAPQSLRDLEGDGVVFTGFVEDLNSFLDQRIATVATLTYGAGIKGKIGSSFAAGVPCICNGMAAEGMELLDGEEVMIADEPEAIAEAIARVCTDRDLWQTLSSNGQAFVERNYSPEVTARSILDALARVGGPPFAGTCPITGDSERRLFDGSLDSLKAGPNSTSCSDRVLLAALASQFGQSETPIERWAIDGLARVPTLVTHDTGAVLDTALASLNLGDELPHSKVLLAKLDCDQDFDSAWREFQPAQSANDISYIAVAIYASSEQMPHSRVKSLFVADLVDRLSAEGFEVRSDRYFLPECAITGTVCVEARRPQGAPN